MSVSFARWCALGVLLGLLGGCVDGPESAVGPGPGTPPAGTEDAPDDGHGHSHARGGASGCEPTPEQQEAADRLVEATLAAVAPLADDATAAVAAGYVPLTVSDYNLYTHFVHPDHRQDDDVLNPAKIEALIYGMTDDGFLLLSAMYMVGDLDDEGPAIGGCLTQWHAHTLGEQQWSGEMLHVWTVPGYPGGPLNPHVDHVYIRSLWAPSDALNPYVDPDCGILVADCHDDQENH